MIKYHHARIPHVYELVVRVRPRKRVWVWLDLSSSDVGSSSFVKALGAGSPVRGNMLAVGVMGRA